MSGLDWLPTLLAAADNPDIADKLKAGKQLGSQNHKAQTAVDSLRARLWG